MKAAIATGNQNTPGSGGEAQQRRPNRGKRKRRHPDNSFLWGCEPFKSSQEAHRSETQQAGVTGAIKEALLIVREGQSDGTL